MKHSSYLNNIPMLFNVFNNTHTKKCTILEENKDFVIAEWNNIEVSNIYYDKYPNKIFLSGQYFIIQMHMQYYHFMLDYLAIYLYLKSKYPELKPLILLKTEDKSGIDNFIYRDILDYLNINENVFIIDSKHYNKENYNLFELEKVLYLYAKPLDVFKFEDVILNFRKHLYQFKTIDKNKKIYISRRDASNRAILKNEDFLEKYFKSKGFTVVSLTGMTVLDQKKIFEDASVVIGRSGTSFTNLFFMSDQTQIIDINIDTEYFNSEYKKIAETLKLNYLNVLVQTDDANELLTKLQDFATIIL